MAWLKYILILALVVTTMPARTAAAATLAALPSLIRVNISGLGTSYARIGSTGSLVVTKDGGAVLYKGSTSTIARARVPRLADPRQAVPGRPDPDGRRNRPSQLPAARLLPRMDETASVI